MGKVITLTRRRDFDRLFERGHRYHHKLLTTVVLVREDDVPPRAAFITSRKVGKAVVRNKVRRRLRGVWRQLVDDLTPLADVAFVAQPTAATASYAELSVVMAQHLREAGLTRCSTV